jgi:hypothetical protein
MWFRMYTETMRDMKIMRLSVTHRWLWVAVLSAARESPVSGELMLTQTLAVDELSLSQYANLRVQDVRAGLKLFQEMELIYWDSAKNAWGVTAWSDRQFESDDVALRVANHRYKKQRSNVTTPLPVTTLQHTIDIDIDIEKEAKASLAEQGKHTEAKTSHPTNVSDLDNSRESAITPQPITPSVSSPKAKPTRQSQSTTTATTSGVQARKRDPLFDAMAVACGHDLENLTKSEGTAIGSAVAEVRHKAGITPQVIHDKAQAYRSMHPDWELTPRALVKHWSALQQARTPWTDPRQKELADLRAEYGAKNDITDVFIKHIQGSAKPPELPPGEVPAEPLHPNQAESNKNTMPAIEIRATETTDSSPSASEEPKERHKPPRRELLEEDWG